MTKTQLINIWCRCGAGTATLASLIDYCTDEGGLDGYPEFIQGSNLHNHVSSKRRGKFYNIITHMPPSLDQNLDYLDYLDQDIDPQTVLSSVATDSFGRILIHIMGLSKFPPRESVLNDGVVPWDIFCPIDACLSEKIEIGALRVKDILNQSNVEFHWHYIPKNYIDIMWFYNNNYKSIIKTLQHTGLTPKKEKVKEFCVKILWFNKPYYDVMSNCITYFTNILNKIEYQKPLSIIESTIVHGLLIHYYKIDDTKNIKLINSLPTSTTDFFELYNI